MTIAQRSSPVHYEDVDATIQELLSEKANSLARETHFVQRRSALDGAHFAQGLVFGWLNDPEASYTFLQEMLALSGCQVSVQALEQRMTPQGAAFFLALLSAFATACIVSEPLTTELLSRFNGVYVQDGTIIALPNELREQYRGCGGNTSESGLSALRVQVRLNVTTGELLGPWLWEAVACEREGDGSLQQTPLPEGALRLTDSGYITLDEVKAHEQGQQFWMSHARADMQLTDARGVQYSLPEFVKAKGASGTIDEWVTWGRQAARQQRVRLIAFARSQQGERQQHVKAKTQPKARAKGSRGNAVVGKTHQPTKTKRHRNHPSKKRLQLAGWTILICNIPEQMLQAHEARVLIGVRWQIELLWRLWKERGQVDIWRSAKPMRILCEVYAKLIGCIIQHWVVLRGCWQPPHRSLVKACLVVKAMSPAYLLSWGGPLTSVQVLEAMGRAMSRAVLNTRPNRLSTSQFLEHPSRMLS